MQNIENYYIPRRLDDPDRFFIWTIDELGMICVPFLVGILWGYIAIGVIAGLILCIGWRRVKGADGINHAIHLLYWHLPMSGLLSLRVTPPSHFRFFAG